MLLHFSPVLLSNPQVECVDGQLTSCGVYSADGVMNGAAPWTESRTPNLLQDTAATCQAFNGDRHSTAGVYAQAVCCKVGQRVVVLCTLYVFTTICSLSNCYIVISN